MSTHRIALMVRYDARRGTVHLGHSCNDTLSSVALLHRKRKLSAAGGRIRHVVIHVRVHREHEVPFALLAVIVDRLRLRRQWRVVVDRGISRVRAPGETAVSAKDGACDEADPLVWFDDEAQGGEFVDRKNENVYPGPVAEIKIDFAVRGKGVGKQETQVDS